MARIVVSIIALLGFALSHPQPGRAQSYPDRPVKIDDTPEQSAADLVADIARFSNIVRAAGSGASP